MIFLNLPDNNEKKIITNMKRFLTFILFMSAFLMVYGQNDSQKYLQEGNTCFERGDYDCAKKNYEASRATGGNVAEQLQKTDECIKLLFAANLLLEGGDYAKAGELYKQILKINSNYSFANGRLKSCEQNLSKNQSQVNRFVNYTETTNNLNIEMVAVEGGAYTMGCTESSCLYNEKPTHRVVVSSFYIGKYEITQAQWIAVMNKNPSPFKGVNLPIESVSWSEVQEFIRRLNAQTGKQYRLPSEAEWEFAARGGNNSKGIKESYSIDNVDWYGENSGGTTHPVGFISSNELGIYDMIGNVWEWCSDWFGDYGSAAQIDPHGPSYGSYRVNRGGCWQNYTGTLRVSFRGYDDPNIRNNFIGFRLACNIK